MRSSTNNALMAAAVMATGITATRVLERAWEEAAGSPAPKNPEASGVSWGEALLWGAAAGVLAGVAKTVTRKGVSQITSNSD